MFIYNVILLISLYVLLTLLIYYVNKHPKKYIIPFANLIAIFIIWIICDTFSFFSPFGKIKIFLYNLSFIGIALIPTSILFLAMSNSLLSLDQKLEKIKRLFYIIPVLFFLIIITNEYHNLFYLKQWAPYYQPNIRVVVEYGPLFYIFMIYSYIIIFLSLSYTLYSFMKKKLRYNEIGYFLVIYISLALIVNLLYIVKIIKFDFTPFCFLVGCITSTILFIKNGIFELSDIGSRNIIHFIEEGVLVVDSNTNKVVEVNNNMLMMMNKNRTDLLFNDIKTVLKEFDETILELDVIRKDQLPAIECFLPKPNKYYNIYVEPILNRRKGIQGKFVIFEDINNRIKNLDNLKSLKKESEDIYNYKTIFLSEINDELKNPINKMLDLSSQIETHKMSHIEKGYLDGINTATNVLYDVINNILDYSKLNFDEMALEEKDTDINKIFKEIYSIFKLKAKEKKLDFIINYDDSIPEVITDGPKIRQVLINLIGNAIKFTEKGHVKVTSKLIEEFYDYAIIDFEVEDTGKGLSDEAVSKIFNPFSQEDESVTRKYGGTGLGLYISKKIIELFNSEISAKCNIEGGCRFNFTIQLKKA